MGRPATDLELVSHRRAAAAPRGTDRPAAAGAARPPALTAQKPAQPAAGVEEVVVAAAQPVAPTVHPAELEEVLAEPVEEVVAATLACRSRA